MSALVIGSSIIDLFFEQKSSSHSHISHNSVSFQLGDKVPIDINKLTLGGNGANVSIGLTRLGVKTSFYTYIGSDILSQEIAQNIRKEGVNIITEKGKGYSSLSLIFNFEIDRIIFSHHPKRTHDFEYTNTIPSYIYLTSIGDPWEAAFKKVLRYVQRHNIALAFSPGSAQMAEINDTFFETLHKSTYLFLNKEEAETILKKFGSPHAHIPQILTELQKLGPTIISLTDGKRGAYAIDEHKRILSIPPHNGDDVKEKTGAGDAYAAGFLAGLIQQLPVEECMRMGGLNSYFVMKEVGAITGLLKKRKMVELLKSSPKYQPKTT